jgi:hypothetical protein
MSWVPYKSLWEVWLEMDRDKYEKALTSSPLERGFFITGHTRLKTCFGAWGESGPATIRSQIHETTYGPPRVPAKVRFAPRLYTAAPVAGTLTSRVRHLQAAARWNALDHQLAAWLADPKNWSKEPLRADDPELIRLLIDAWAELAPDDPHNQSLDEAAPTIGIGDGEKERLKSAGVRDLRGLAQAINAAPKIERHNARIERHTERMLAAAARRPEAEGVGEAAAATLEPLAVPVSVEDATRLRQAIGRALSGIDEPGTEPPAASPPKRGQAKKGK